MKKLITVVVCLAVLGGLGYSAYRLGWIGGSGGTAAPGDRPGAAQQAGSAGAAGTSGIVASAGTDSLVSPDRSTGAMVTAEVAERLGRTLYALEQAEKATPRDTFEPRALVEKVGKDPDALFAWVRDNTYWVPYRGALRGSAGVLMDRLGNSLDRALLLAELLQAAGHTVQLAHATLPDDEAAEVIRGARAVPNQPLPALPEPTDDELRTVAERLARDYQLDATRLEEAFKRVSAEATQMTVELKRRVAEQAPVLAKAVGTASVSEDSAKKALLAAADHWWVQRKDAGQWVDLDPTLPEARPAAAQSRASRAFPLRGAGGTLSLPAQFCHEVNIRAVVEQWRDGRLIEKTPLRFNFRPAELVGQTIVFQNAPVALPADFAYERGQDPGAALTSELLTQKEWLPYLTVGGKTVSESTFTDTGDLGRWPKGGSGPSGGAGGLFGGLLGGDETGGAQQGGILTAEWIDYEIRVPGERPRTVRREIFDLLGPLARPQRPVPDPAPNAERLSARAQGLMHTIQILPLACRPAPAFLGRQAVLEAIGNRDALNGLAVRIAAGDADGSLARARQMKLTTGRLYDLAAARFAASPVAADVYLDSPNLLTYHTSLGQDSSGAAVLRQGYDIVANDVAVRRGPKADPFLVRLTQGTVDTNAEGLLQGPGTLGNAGLLLSASGPAGGSWMTIGIRSETEWKALAWPPEVRSRIEQELAAGFVVVAPRPESLPAGSGQCAWWRIDPRTGQALGIGTQGWGQGLSERAIQVLKVNAAFLSVGMISFDLCVGKKWMADRAGFQNAERRMGILSDCACSGLASGSAGGAYVLGTFGGAGLPALGVAMLLAGIAKETFCG